MIQAIIDTKINKPGALLLILHDLQSHFGYIPEDSIPLIAESLNQTAAEISGVISFYHHFRTTPPGKHVVQLCRAEACQSVGARQLETHVKNTLGVDFHQTTEDKAFTLEPVYCLGNCACGPSIQVNDAVHGHMSAEKFDQLLPTLEQQHSNPDHATSPGDPPVRIYVPRETTALSLGADRVAGQILAEAAARNTHVELIRNGSRGLFWLEPLVEVETPKGRVAYGPVGEQDVAALFDSGLLEGNQTHALCQGLTEDIAYLKNQQRLTFSRIGITTPTSIDDYKTLDGFQGLANALTLEPHAIVEAVKTSGLRGRGGAAFPAGIKWETVLKADSDQKYIVCNADEGDSGTFADRLVMECDPFMLIEGMTIAGMAVGATQGYIYLRSEYPLAFEIFNEAIARAYDAGYLGDNIQGSRYSFHLEVRLGAGAYICGEETSLLESLEGKRGMVRAKPPLPALVGLFGKPTVVNNVLTLAAIPYILQHGAEAYAQYGVGRSRGTLAFQLAGNVKRGGLIELAFGTTLRQLMDEFGQGTSTGRPLRAVQVGGPLGAYLPEAQWDTELDYEQFAAIDAVLGHGGIVLFDDSVDMAEQARFSMEFCRVESCGKCTPCRIGSTRGVEVIDRIRANQNREQNLELLNDLCDTMVDGSLCAMGGMTPFPVRSAVKHFADDFNR